MVHTLEDVKRLLQPEGALFCSHDLPIHHVIEFHAVGRIIKTGWLTDNADYDNEQSAWKAIAQVVSNEDFRLEDEREFAYDIHADSLIELQQWLEDWWETTFIEDYIISRIEKLYQQHSQDAKIVLKVPARMTFLKVKSSLFDTL